MGIGRTSLTVALAGALAACGGGGGSSASGGSSGPIAGTPTPSPTATPAACSLSAREDWVKAQIDEWYLFPDLVDNTVNKANYSNVQDYIDALLAPARAQSKDRYFTYITSIAEENAFYNSGSSAGFGVRLGYDTANNRVFVLESFEGAPALGAGIDRGTEILAIGSSSSSLQNVSTLMASGGPQAVVDALGPSTAGLTRVLRISAGGVTREVSISKTDYSLDPVSDRYGAKIIQDGAKQIGYLNLRTFIDTADPNLRDAFANFRAQGITEVIVDLRYNGGGLVSMSELLGDLLGGNQAGKVFDYTTFRDSKAANNEVATFTSQPQSIGATKIAFIGLGGTASASELVINAFVPYLGNNMALVGSNTYGKPVGQIGLDKTECDDRLRVIAFKLENANQQGEYFNGLAGVVPNTCAATDDITHQLGDPNETIIKTAIDFLDGRTCTPITASGQSTLSIKPRKDLLTPERPRAAQREVPGLF
ncbi:MAG: S41 family peptidase [Tsuneonella sp.]